MDDVKKFIMERKGILIVICSALIMVICYAVKNNISMPDKYTNSTDTKYANVHSDEDIIITDVNFLRDGKYIDSEIAVKNTGYSTLRYIKINIFLLDENENIIGSYWTNSSSELPPNASHTITKSVPYNNNCKSLRAEISECSFK